MAAFSTNPDEWQREDLHLLQNGFIHKYWSESVLDKTVGWLTDNGYAVSTLNAGDWTTSQDMQLAVGHALGFPEDFRGSSLDAFNDWLRSVAIFEFGSDPASSGTALVLPQFDRFVSRQGDAAQALLEMFDDAGRLGALFGHRMLMLLQSDDPDLELPHLGTTPVRWNPAEAQLSTRHPGSDPRPSA